MKLMMVFIYVRDDLLFFIKLDERMFLLFSFALVSVCGLSVNC